MKTVLIYAAMIVFSVVSLNCVSSASASEGEQQAVKAAVQEFHTALNKLFTGEVAPMKSVWSHQADVTYMGPDGSYLRGWKLIAAEWDKTASMKLGGQIEAAEMHITVGQDIAIVSNYEMGHNIGPDGKKVKVKIRATSLFRKEKDAWKMIGHHTDLLPFLVKPAAD